MRRKRRTWSAVLALGMILILAACGSQKTEPAADTKAESVPVKEAEKNVETAKPVDPSGTVVVYSPHDADPLNDGIKQFMQKYPEIRVEVVAAGTGELINRIKMEASQPVADVLWGGGADSVAAYKEYFAPYISANDAAIPAVYKDAEHIWTGESPLPMVLFYNKELIEKAGLAVPQSWEDLLQPQWRGKIAYCAPAKSGSAYTQLCTMLFGHGGTEKGWEFVRQFYANLDGKLLDASSQCHKLVAAGEYYVGLTLEKAAVRYADDKSVAFVYPADGTSAAPDSVALVKNAPHPDNAKLFIDFVTSAEWQQRQSKMWGRRPVRADVDAPAGMGKLSEIRLVDYDVEWAANNKEIVLEQFNEMAEQEENAEAK